MRKRKEKWGVLKEHAVGTFNLGYIFKEASLNQTDFMGHQRAVI